MKAIIKRIQEASVKAPKRTKEFVYYKCIEELGELAKAINQPERCDEPALSELADFTIAITDFAYLCNFSATPSEASRMLPIPCLLFTMCIFRPSQILEGLEYGTVQEQLQETYEAITSLVYELGTLEEFETAIDLKVTKWLR